MNFYVKYFNFLYSDTWFNSFFFYTLFWTNECWKASRRCWLPDSYLYLSSYICSRGFNHCPRFMIFISTLQIQKLTSYIFLKDISLWLSQWPLWHSISSTLWINFYSTQSPKSDYSLPYQQTQLLDFCLYYLSITLLTFYWYFCC